jgi:putative transposase
MLKPTLSYPHNINEGNNTSRFEKLTHVLWHCQYHIVWVPKYRYRVLKGVIGQEVHNSIEVFSGQLQCQVVELKVQPDHVHLLVKVPPKVSISKLMGVVKGRTALRYSFAQSMLSSLRDW